MFIKEISEIKDEVTSKKMTKMVISDNGVDTEIILEGNGKLKVTTTASV